MNTMGFKRVSSVPKKIRRSMYDPLIENVAKTGDIYMLDVKDLKRANSLSTQLRIRIKKLGVPVKVYLRYTSVYIAKAEVEDD